MLKPRHQGLARAILVAGLAALAVAAVPAPAAAQNFFNFFFNNARPAPPPWASAYADPRAQSPGTPPSEPAPRVESGPAVSYCVRLCDGRFFPIQRSSATPIEICNSFCPASRTKVFSGGSIDHAVARDGSRYADLANAFVYRSRVVPGCSCNGKDAFGLAPVTLAEDPTLRPGDVVATEDGFVAYNGGHKHGDFTPIASASSVPAEARRQLARTKIVPASPPAETAEVLSGRAAARDTSDRQAQLAR